MNANESATERSQLFLELEKANEALRNAKALVSARCAEIRRECTHVRDDGKTAILSQSEGLFDYCNGCGKEF